VDTANNCQPLAVKSATTGKGARPFALFVERRQSEILIHKMASTNATAKSHINNILLPAFGKLAIGNIDSERVQSLLNRQIGEGSTKTVKNRCLSIRTGWEYTV
jgi:hypothetical protein